MQDQAKSFSMETMNSSQAPSLPIVQSSMKKASQDLECKLIQDEVKARFIQHCNPEGFIDQGAFKKVMGIKDPDYSKLLFTTMLHTQQGSSTGLDPDYSKLLFMTMLQTPQGSSTGLRLEYVLESIRRWSTSSQDCLASIFAICDTAGTGEIGTAELIKVLKHIQTANKMELSEAEVQTMAAAIIHACAKEKSGKITVADFINLVKGNHALPPATLMGFPIGTSPDFSKSIAKRMRHQEAEHFPRVSWGPSTAGVWSASATRWAGAAGTRSGRPLLPPVKTTAVPTQAPASRPPMQADALSMSSRESQKYLSHFDDISLSPASVGGEGAASPSKLSSPTRLSLSLEVLAALKSQAAPLASDHKDQKNGGEGLDGAIEDTSEMSIPDMSDTTHPLIQPRRTSWWWTVLRRGNYLASTYWSQMLVVVVWVLLNFELFTMVFHKYMRMPDFLVLGYGICFTKACAETLKLNFALILLPVCGHITTYIQMKLQAYLPALDHKLIFHRLVAAGVTAGVIGHAGGHLIFNFPVLTDPANRDAVMKYTPWGMFHGRQAKYGELFLTPVGISGMIMVLSMIIAFPLAIKRCRTCIYSRLPSSLKFMASFDAFYMTHHLLLINYIAIIWHGSHRHWGLYPTTSSWMYIAGPLLLYAWNRLSRIYNGRFKLSGVEVKKAMMHPGNVLALHMVRPNGFKYKSGMYIHINCPQISFTEWHPFTLTSCPFDNELVIHVRKQGAWTTTLHNLFKECLKKEESCQSIEVVSYSGKAVKHLVERIPSRPPPALGKERGDDVSSSSATSAPANETNPARSSLMEPDNNHEVSIRLAGRLFPKVFIDGPMGAPSQEYRRYKVVLLVGAGIGVTPFASILAEVARRIELKQISPYFEEETKQTSPLAAGAPVQSDLEGHPWSRSASERYHKKVMEKGHEMKAFQTEKVYMVWMTRDQHSLTWFRDRMDKVVAFDNKNVIELHQYLSAVPSDSRSMVLKLGQLLVHQKSGFDPITGMCTKVATHFGRPDWDMIFHDLILKHPAQAIGIFTCGPAALSQDLSSKAEIYSTMPWSTTRFHFHKETF